MAKQSRFWSRLLVLSQALPRLLFGRRKPARPQRILVAHHLLLGDSIMLAGLFKKLRRDYPGAQIDSLVPTPWLPIFAGRPYGVRGLAYDLRVVDSQKRLIAEGPYDWALVPADNRWAWIARAMGARWVTAFAGGGGGIKDWPVDEFIAWPQTPEAWGDIASRLAPGTEPSALPAWRMAGTAAADNGTGVSAVTLRRAAPRRLQPAQDVAARALAGAGRRAERRRPDRRLVGRAERNRAGPAADPEGRYVDLAGRYDMAGLWHLLAGAALLVSPDTGVVHLARLTGTPAVVLFGPGSPVVSGPGRFWKDSPFAVVWEENIACRDQSLLFERPLPWVRHCWRSVADCGQPRCMWQIDNQKVMQAIEKVTGIMLARERA